MGDYKDDYVFTPDIYGEALAVHIAASAVACLVAVFLMIRVMHNFTLSALLGLLVAYAYVNQNLLGFASKWISVGAASAVLETVAQALICGNLLHLGRTYRTTTTTTTKNTRLYTYATNATILYALCMVPWAVLYASFGLDAPDLNRAICVIYFCHIAAQLFAHSSAYAYAFMPSLRVAFNRKQAQEPMNAISAENAAEGIWYSIVMAVHISQTTVFTVIPTLGMFDVTLIALNALRVALSCFVVLVLALPPPRLVVRWTENKYAGRAVVASDAELTAVINKT